MFEYLIMDKTIYSQLDDSDAAFIGFITMYGKSYLTLDEYRKRKALFEQNVKKISKQQLLIQQHYVLGLNHMSDWSMEEYFATLGVLPEGNYPQEIIPEDDDSWKQIDTEDEEDYWPTELQGDGNDRPTDIPGSHINNSLFFWGSNDDDTVEI